MIFHRDREALEHAQQIAAEWLRGMGLEMKPSKTRITHTLEAIDGPAGFEFLGFHCRRTLEVRAPGHANPHGKPLGFTPSIRPSQQSQKRLLLQDSGDRPQPPQCSASGADPAVEPDHPRMGELFLRSRFKEMSSGRWTCTSIRSSGLGQSRRHPNKGRRWIARQYWLLGKRGWTFGIDGKITMHKLSEIPIRRHVKVLGDRSPFDGDAFYWSARLGAHPELPRGMPQIPEGAKG